MCSTFFHFTDLSPSKEALALESTLFLLDSAHLSSRFARRNLETTSQWEQLSILEKTNPEIIRRAALIILKNLRRFSFFCKDFSDLFVLTYSHFKFIFYLPKYLFDLILSHVIIVMFIADMDFLHCNRRKFTLYRRVEVLPFLNDYRVHSFYFQLLLC